MTGDSGNDRRGLNMILMERNFPECIVEQKKLIDKFSEISMKTKKLEMIYKQKLADLEELKKSILAEAFAGKL